MHIAKISDFALTIEGGSICLLWAQTEEGKGWIKDNIDPEHQKWAAAVVIEHRFVGDIVNGIHTDGLTIKDVIDTRKRT